MVGGQDELVFDGDSMVVSRRRRRCSPGRRSSPRTCSSSTSTCRSRRLRARGRRPTPAPDGMRIDADARVRRAAGTGRRATARRDRSPTASPTRPRSGRRWCSGLRDYVRKNGFRSVVLALSGGIDSAVVAAIAVRRDRRPPNVVGVSMPSAYSSEHSKDDAADLAKRTGLDYRVEPIAPMVDAFMANLHLTGLAAENLQARVRGVILMGLSNQEGHLVLTTGNKSELVGRLLDALRRLGRRLQPAEGRAEDAGVEARRVAQRGGRAPRRDPADPGELDHEAAERRAAARTSSTPTRCPTTRCSTRSSPATSTATSAATGWSRPATTRRSSTGCCAWSTSPNTSGGSRAPGTKISIKAFGRDRRLPITNGFRERAR